MIDVSSLSTDERSVLVVLVRRPGIPEDELAEAANVVDLGVTLASLVTKGLLRRSPKGNLVIPHDAKQAIGRDVTGASCIAPAWNQVFYFSAVHEQANRHWRASILKSVEWALGSAMSEAAAERLLECTGDALLMAWACKATEDAYWSQMRVGDLCLACTPGVTDAFTIAGKTDSQAFGRAVWEDPEYCRVYFLVDRKPAAITRPRFLEDCGFDPHYIIQGTRRLTQERIGRIEARYGSLEAWLGAPG